MVAVSNLSQSGYLQKEYTEEWVKSNSHYGMLTLLC